MLYEVMCKLSIFVSLLLIIVCDTFKGVMQCKLPQIDVNNLVVASTVVMLLHVVYLSIIMIRLVTHIHEHVGTFIIQYCTLVFQSLCIYFMDYKNSIYNIKILPPLTFWFFVFSFFVSMERISKVAC